MKLSEKIMIVVGGVLLLIVGSRFIGRETEQEAENLDPVETSVEREDSWVPWGDKRPVGTVKFSQSGFSTAPRAKTWDRAGVTRYELGQMGDGPWLQANVDVLWQRMVEQKEMDAIAQELASYGPKGVEYFLMRVLTVHTGPTTGDKVMDVLRRLPERVERFALVRMLRCQTLIAHLAELQVCYSYDPRMLDELLSFITVNPPARTREQRCALALLRRFGTRAAVPHFLASNREGRREVLALAMTVNPGDGRSEVKRMLASGKSEDLEDAHWILRRAAEPDLAVLLHDDLLRGGSGERRALTLQTLARMRQYSSIPILLQLQLSASAGEREQIDGCLQRIVGPHIKVRSWPDWWEKVEPRWRKLEATLERALSPQLSVSERLESFNSVAMIRDPKLTEAIIELLKSPSRGLAIRASRCAANQELRAAVPELIRLLASKQPNVRTMAHMALGRITKQKLGSSPGAWVRYWTRVSRRAPTRKKKS